MSSADVEGTPGVDDGTMAPLTAVEAEESPALLEAAAPAEVGPAIAPAGRSGRLASLRPAGATPLLSIRNIKKYFPITAASCAARSARSRPSTT